MIKLEWPQLVKAGLSRAFSKMNLNTLIYRHDLISCLTKWIHNKQKIQKTEVCWQLHINYMKTIYVAIILIWGEKFTNVIWHIIATMRKYPIGYCKIIKPINPECWTLDIRLAECCLSKLWSCLSSLHPVSELFVAPSSSPDTGVTDSVYVVLGVVCGFCLLLLILWGAICVHNRTSDSWFGYADNLSPSVQTQRWFNYQTCSKYDCLISEATNHCICDPFVCMVSLDLDLRDVDVVVHFVLGPGGVV